MRERWLPPHLNLAKTIKDFPQTYTMTKATHKGLLRAFDFRNINSGPEAEREGEV